MISKEELELHRLTQELTELGYPFVLATATEDQWIISSANVSDYESLLSAIEAFAQSRIRQEEESRVQWN